MKNLKTSIVSMTLVMVSLFFISSCMNNTKVVTPEQSPSTFNTLSYTNDINFLVSAAEINIEQISLGKLAQLKGIQKHVIDLGKMIDEEHTNSMMALTVLAETKDIKLPSAVKDDAMDDFKLLEDKTRDDFEKAFSDMMVKKQQEAIAIFEKGSIESNYPDVKAWAIAAIPTLRHLLEQALICQKECNKVKSPSK